MECFIGIDALLVTLQLLGLVVNVTQGTDGVDKDAGPLVLAEGLQTAQSTTHVGVKERVLNDATSEK